MQRAITIVLSTAILLSAAACAGPPKRMYPGPEKPAAEVAILREIESAAIIGINNKRVTGTAWAVLPGWQDVWLRVKMYSDNPGVTWTAWSYCRVPIKAAAGQEYKTYLKIERETAGLGSKMKPEFGFLDAAGEIAARPVSCTGEKPKFPR